MWGGTLALVVQAVCSYRQGHAGHADGDGEEGWPRIAVPQEEVGENKHCHNGEAVQHLHAGEGGVLIRLDGEEVALDVHQGDEGIGQAVPPQGGADPRALGQQRQADGSQRQIVEEALGGGQANVVVGGKRLAADTAAAEKEGEQLPKAHQAGHLLPPGCLRAAAPRHHQRCLFLQQQRRRRGHIVDGMRCLNAKGLQQRLPILLGPCLCAHGIVTTACHGESDATCVFRIWT